MQGQLVVTQFEGRDGRVLIENGQPHFVARDVARWLEYPETSIEQINNLTAKVPGEWIDHKQIMGKAGKRKALTLTEQGFYFFVIRSDKPKALPLQKFVAGEVLPSIFRTGSYTMPGYESITSAQAAEAMNELMSIDPRTEMAIRRDAVSSYKSLVRSARHLDAAVYDRLIGYYEKGLSYKDIATLLGTSESSVKRWVDRLVAAGLVDRREK